MKTIKVESKDRIELLKYVNVLREFNCNTSEKVPISYEHICEMETLMYRLANLLEFALSFRVVLARHGISNFSSTGQHNAPKDIQEYKA